MISNFDNQNLISYQDNFRAKGDIPFVIYFDFETTAPTDNCFDPEQKKMFVFSYVMIVTFLVTVNKLKLFYSRANQFYWSCLIKNVKRYDF